jgi:hypothetical protein
MKNVIMVILVVALSGLITTCKKSGSGGGGSVGGGSGGTVCDKAVAVQNEAINEYCKGKDSYCCSCFCSNRGKFRESCAVGCK